MPDDEIHKWALKGAEQRLLQVNGEATKIYTAFPEVEK